MSAVKLTLLTVLCHWTPAVIVALGMTQPIATMWRAPLAARVLRVAWLNDAAVRRVAARVRARQNVVPSNRVDVAQSRVVYHLNIAIENICMGD